MKFIPYAGMVCLTMMFISCIKERPAKSTETQLADAKAQLHYIKEVVITEGGSPVHIPIDSNTAIVHANGDTTFPLWYRKKLAGAARTSNGRYIGDTNDYGAIVQELDNLTAPVKAADGAGYDFSYSVPTCYKSVSFIEYHNGQYYAYMGTYTSGSGGPFAYTFADRRLIYSEYYTDMEADTYDANGNNVAYMNRKHFYAYGFQQISGLGTAYGADMKVTDIDNNGVPDLVGMIANRTSAGINGISFKVIKNISTNGVPGSQTNAVTKLLSSSKSTYAPTGGAVAVADLNGNGIKDFVFATYSSTTATDPYYFRYIIAYDINSDGQPASWSGINTVDGFTTNSDNKITDIGIAITDISGDGVNDIVLAGNWVNSNQVVTMYKVGTSITSTGSATWPDQDYDGQWSQGFPTGTISNVKGGGIAIARIGDKPGGPQLVMMCNYYTNAGTPTSYNMPIMLKNSTSAAGTDFYQGTHRTFTFENMGGNVQGGGVDIADIDGNGTLDLLNMAYDDNQFRFYIGYDMVMHYYSTVTDASGTYDYYGMPYFKHGMTTSYH